MREAIFWFSIGFIFYTYVGYPLLLWVWRRVARPAPPRRALPDKGSEPFVSILVTVRNEAQHIRRKIHDLLAIDYPADRFEILVASDASTDGTNTIVRRARRSKTARVRLVAYVERIGKAEAINRTVSQAVGEILVFMDARQRVDPSAIRALLANFADPEVGMVGGELVLVNEEGDPNRESTGLYWRYETWLRGVEADLKLLSGVSGCCFAMRKSLFRPAPAGSILDDVIYPLQVLQQGSRVWWERSARVYDRVMAGRVELARRVRSLTGNYQLLALFWPLFCPWSRPSDRWRGGSPGGNPAWSPGGSPGRVAFSLLSHKLCRLLVPLALLATAVTTLALLPRPFYVSALALQGSLYLIGAAGALSGWLRRNSRLANACGTFCLLNLAALVALLNLLVRGGPRVAWR